MSGVRNLLRDGMERGRHAGAQVYVERGGRIIADFAVGMARPDCPMTTDTLLEWRSTCKPIAAVAAVQLVERNALRLDQRVGDLIPAFNRFGKESITIRHLLLHTGGFRAATGGWPDADWDRIIQGICDTRLEPGWIPGEKAGYHPATSWFILGDIIRRIDGRPFDQYAREEILLPLGMADTWFVVPAPLAEAYGRRLGTMYNTRGREPKPATGPTASLALCSPGSSARGPIREAGYLYRMLLNGGAVNRTRVLSAESAASITARHRIGMYDHTFHHVVDWGLGLILNTPTDSATPMPYGYGRHASASAYGHSGAESSCAFADPAHDLVVAWACNGAPGETAHQERQHTLNTMIYEDLGIAGTAGRRDPR